MVAARKEILEAMLSPEAMLAEPPLTERDFEIFIEFFSLLLNSDQRFDFKAFAASNGITLRRFNYVSAKISWPLGEPSRRGPIVNELGLGVLMNGEEREIFLRREPELAKIAESLGQALRR
jgi:hypothetical protein